MKITLDQNSNNWLEWRRQGIGASDVPAIMGTCDFRTALQVWEDKTGRAEPRPQNPAMRRGSEAESKIRALYEFKSNIEAPPVVAQHEGYPFMRASLDGFNEELGLIVEIKYPSLAKHEIAKSGKVPETYQDQVQAQLFVTGARRCDYVSYDGKDIAIVQVEPDLKRIKEIVERCSRFWNDHVLKNTAPEPTEKDFKKLNSPFLHEAFEKYKVLKNKLDEVDEQLKAQKELLIKAIENEHPRVMCNGVKVSKVERTGSVDYKKIPELKNIDLQQYRKPNTFYWDFRINDK